MLKKQNEYKINLKWIAYILHSIIINLTRSRRSKMYQKIGALKDFAKLEGKQLWLSFFLQYQFSKGDGSKDVFW